tara:strand:- start:384 stop:773 length:390 start_codon:yes stop_codon:yes gene_type:complete
MTEITDIESSARCKITFISRSAPYGQNRAKLCLDMALAAAVFEQEVNYVFMDDGVYQLLKGQTGSAIDCKTLGNALETLSLYGIDNVYAEKASLAKRGIDESELLPGLRTIENADIADMIGKADKVFNL